jgi:hypothetical protein
MDDIKQVGQNWVLYQSGVVEVFDSSGLLRVRMGAW